MKNKTVNKATYGKLLEIAKESIWAIKERGNLERQMSDSADFIETAVWSIEELMLKAYELGYNKAQSEIARDLRKQGYRLHTPQRKCAAPKSQKEVK